MTFGHIAGSPISRKKFSCSGATRGFAAILLVGTNACATTANTRNRTTANLLILLIENK